MQAWPPKASDSEMTIESALLALEAASGGRVVNAHREILERITPKPHP